MAVGRFDGTIGVHGGFGDEQPLAGRAIACSAPHHNHGMVFGPWSSFKI
jgi:hypothetical protein